MKIKSSYILLLFWLLSCTSESIRTNTLADVVKENSNLQQDEVIACAASKQNDNQTTYVFYYPIPTATNIQYFETESIHVDKNDFSKYQPKELEKEAVFNGYLERFVRNNAKEVWCAVTYNSAGKFHKSNPILLKHQSKPTEWTDEVTIDDSESLSPKFTWNDGVVKENAIYFQVVADATSNLLSGTYTYEKSFQYYNLTNVVLNITQTPPPSLLKDNNYSFTMMGVSEDNWVNLVIQKNFEAK